MRFFGAFSGKVWGQNQGNPRYRLILARSSSRINGRVLGYYGAQGLPKGSSN